MAVTQRKEDDWEYRGERKVRPVKRNTRPQTQPVRNGQSVRNGRPAGKVQSTRSSRNKLRKKKRRRQLLKKRITALAITAAAVLLVVQAVRLKPFRREHVIEKEPAQLESYEVSSKGAGDSLPEEIRSALKEQAKEDGRVADILDHCDSYPKDLLELLSKNPEAVDFVLDYPEKGDKAPADALEDVNKGTVPLLLQWDESWGYAQYGGNFLACTGCGPTCLSMVAAGLTGDASVTPWAVAQFAEKNGYYEAGAGTKWSLMSEGAAEFGVQGREISLDVATVLGELDAGHPIICSMRPGDFTTTGHFIVLTGQKDGKIQVHDPNSRIRSEKLWDYDALARQIRNLWAFE